MSVLQRLDRELQIPGLIIRRSQPSRNTFSCRRMPSVAPAGGGDTCAAQRYEYKEGDEPFTALDCLIGNYYINQGINTYFDDNGDGGFIRFIFDEELDEFDLTLDKELGLDCRSHECIYTEFDDKFPIHKDIAHAIDLDNELTKEDVIYYVIQHCHLKHAAPTHKQLLDIIEDRKKIKIAPPPIPSAIPRATVASGLRQGQGPRGADLGMGITRQQSDLYNQINLAPGHVIEIYNEAEFFKYVYNAEIKQLVVVDFGATWCPFSKRFNPKLENLAYEYKNKVTFLKIETDRQEERWTQPYQQTRGVPEFQFWKGCQIVDIVSGADEFKIRNAVRKHM